jgi:hypothetical protein
MNSNFVLHKIKETLLGYVLEYMPIQINTLHKKQIFSINHSNYRKISISPSALSYYYHI